MSNQTVGKTFQTQKKLNAKTNEILKPLSSTSKISLIYTNKSPKINYKIAQIKKKKKKKKKKTFKKKKKRKNNKKRKKGQKILCRKKNNCAEKRTTKK